MEDTGATVGTTNGVDGTALLAYGGFLAVIIGSIGPWATTPLSSVAGTSGDGVMTIAAAALGLITLAIGWMPFARVFAVAAAAIGVYDAVHIHQKAQQVVAFGVQIAHVGWGVYVVIAGGVIAALMSLMIPTPKG